MNFTHQHIIKYNSVFVHHSNIIIEMEFCISSLSNVTKQISKQFHVTQTKKIIFTSHDIIHRDIKPRKYFH